MIGQGVSNTPRLDMVKMLIFQAGYTYPYIGCDVRDFVRDVVKAPLYGPGDGRGILSAERKKRRKHEVERTPPWGLLGVIPTHTLDPFQSLWPIRD